MKNKITWKQKAEILEWVLKDIHWIARRYATNRRSYAPSVYNEAIIRAMEVGFKPMKDAIEKFPTYLAEEGK